MAKAHTVGALRRLINDSPDEPPAHRRKLSKRQVDALFRRLEQLGRAAYCHTANVSPAACLGMALCRRISPEETIQVAKTMLEDWNGHLSYAAIDAIECGNGDVKREGRTLTIILPEHWANIR